MEVEIHRPFGQARRDAGLREGPFTMRRLLPLAAVVVAGLSACGEEGEQSSQSSESPRSFTAQLRPLNDSGVKGTVKLVPREVEGESILQVDIDATGLTPNRIHPQQIRGFVGGGIEAECPDDEGGDLLVRDEAQNSYGEVIEDLAPYPTVGDDGDLNWDLPVEVNSDRLQPLGDRVVVLYGKRANRASSDAGTIYEPKIPVACGKVQRR